MAIGGAAGRLARPRCGKIGPCGGVLDAGGLEWRMGMASSAPAPPAATGRMSAAPASSPARLPARPSSTSTMPETPGLLATSVRAPPWSSASPALRIGNLGLRRLLQCHCPLGSTTTSAPAPYRLLGQCSGRVSLRKFANNADPPLQRLRWWCRHTVVWFVSDGVCALPPCGFGN